MYEEKKTKNKHKVSPKSDREREWEYCQVEFNECFVILERKALYRNQTGKIQRQGSLFKVWNGAERGDAK
jgi:hypothetical protein